MEVIRTLIAGMDIGDELTLAAIIVALGLGVSSLIQTQILQKRERRERLLNEIIEWAEDVSKCGLDRDLDVWRDFAARYFDKFYEPNFELSNIELGAEKEMAVIEYIDVSELMNSFIRMKGGSRRSHGSHYIKKISSTFGHDLQNAIMKLTDDLEVHIELLLKFQKSLDEKRESIKKGITQEQHLNSADDLEEEIGNHKQQLDLSAQKVIEEATKIKTKDIG